MTSRALHNVCGDKEVLDPGEELQLGLRCASKSLAELQGTAGLGSVLLPQSAAGMLGHAAEANPILSDASLLFFLRDIWRGLLDKGGGSLS
jgi:hypothetical protein